MARNSRRNIGKAVAASDARGGALEVQDGNLLAPVVGPLPAWIATVIGGDDDEIVRPAHVLELGQPCVERFERCCISCYIAPMPIDCVEVYEIRKQKPAIAKGVEPFECAIEERVVAVRLQHATGPRMREYVGNLTD